jgi:hypothetical protein
MSDESGRRLTGLNDAAGILLFCIATVVAWMAANPRFPNERGPMPAGLPYVAFAFVLVLIAAAFRDRGWRRVARGFALGWVMLFVATRGGCTSVWTDMAVGLDPTRAVRARARIQAQRDEAMRRELPKRIAEAQSPSERAYMVRRLGIAARCAFAYRDARPHEGFPRSLAELGTPDGGCGNLAVYPGTPNLTLRPPTDPALPVTRLALRLGPPAHLGLSYPQYTMDERGIFMVRDTSANRLLVVASPVPALLELRRCLLAAVPSRYRTDSLSLIGLLATSGEACESLHSQLIRDDTTMELAVTLDSRIAARGEPEAARYLVRYAPVRSRPDEGFELLAAAGDRPAFWRRYRVTADGRVHVTTDARDATEGDPPPAPCEVDPAVACE